MYGLVFIEAIVNPKEDWSLLTPLSLISVNLFIKNCMSQDPNWLPFVPLLLSTINSVLPLEWELTSKPDTCYQLPQTILNSLFLSEIFHIIAISSRRSKMFGNISMWLYFIVRLYFRYNFFDKYILALAGTQIVISD